MTTPKYPTEVEPAIWLQVDEDKGHADCGCNLAQDNGAKLNYCTMHAAAPELLEALEGAIRFMPIAYAPRTLALAAIRKAKGLPDDT